MSTLYYPYWWQDHSYVQMDATTPMQYFWVNNADKSFVVTYIANTRAARVKCRICGMAWVRNSIIMLNVIYTEWFKELNSTVKRARHSRPENGACSTSLKTPIFKLPIVALRTTSNEGWRKCQSKVRQIVGLMYETSQLWFQSFVIYVVSEVRKHLEKPLILIDK